MAKSVNPGAGFRRWLQAAAAAARIPHVSDMGVAAAARTAAEGQRSKSPQVEGGNCLRLRRCRRILHTGDKRLKIWRKLRRGLGFVMRLHGQQTN